MHFNLTEARVRSMADALVQRGRVSSIDEVIRIVEAADRVDCAGMWPTAHMTDARNVCLDGRELGPGDFKAEPAGHTGRALNMVPAHVGELTANALFANRCTWAHAIEAVAASLHRSVESLLSKDELAAVRGQGNPAVLAAT